MEKLKEIYTKFLLISSLKNRSKNNYITLLFVEEKMIFCKTGRRKNIYYAVELTRSDYLNVANRFQDGSFLIAAGKVQNAIYHYILSGSGRWNRVITWKE